LYKHYLLNNGPRIEAPLKTKRHVPKSIKGIPTKPNNKPSPMYKRFKHKYTIIPKVTAKPANEIIMLTIDECAIYKGDRIKIPKNVGAMDNAEKTNENTTPKKKSVIFSLLFV